LYRGSKCFQKGSLSLEGYLNFENLWLGAV